MREQRRELYSKSGELQGEEGGRGRDGLTNGVWRKGEWVQATPEQLDERCQRKMGGWGGGGSEMAAWNVRKVFKRKRREGKKKKTGQSERNKLGRVCSMWEEKNSRNTE